MNSALKILLIVAIVAVLGYVGYVSWLRTSDTVITNDNSAEDVEFVVSTSTKDDKGEQDDSTPEDQGSTNGSGSGATVTPAQLEGTTFYLVSANGKAIGSQDSHTLTFADGRVSARFCNSVGGNFTVEAGKAKGMLISTMMFCSEPSGIMEAENLFSRMFTEGVVFQRVGNTLTLTATSGETLVFTAK